MPKTMNSKISLLVTAFAVSMSVLCVVATGMARGGKSGGDAAMPSGKASVQQDRRNSTKSSGNAGVRQDRRNTANPSSNAGVHQQDRRNTAKSSGKTSVQQDRRNTAKSSGKTSVQQDRRNTAKSSGNTSVQQGRRNTAKPSSNAGVRQQGRPNTAKPSSNAGARQQDRRNTVKSSGKTSVHQQGRPDMKATGNAVLSRPGRRSRPTSKSGMAAYQRAQRGESLQGWGTRAQVNPVYVTKWHKPRYQTGYYYYDGYGNKKGFKYGGWAFGKPKYRHYNAPYFTHGLLFINAERVVIVRQPVYVYYPVPDYRYYDSSYQRNDQYSSLNSALTDIFSSWLNDNGIPITRHITPTERVAVYIDGKYAYSMPGNDYRDMTEDAMRNTGTITFAPYKVAKRSDGAYTAYAKQQFYDADQNYKVAYVTYTMVPKKGKWTIVGVGSSDHRLN
ncbi:MAG: hypothetical protein ACYC1M_02765 [Armatimonadota bacterium]